MMAGAVLLTGVAGVSGAVLMYLATPAQALLVRSWRRRRCVVWGCVLLGVAFGGLLAIEGSGTAIFSLLTLMMAVWSVGPVVLAFVRRPS